MIGWAEDFKSSFWVKYLKPILDYVVRIAELMALAAVFRVAADQVHSPFLEILATILICIIGAYAGIPLGLLFHRLRGVSTKSLVVAIANALPIAVAIAAMSFLGGVEVSRAVKALSQVSVNDR